MNISLFIGELDRVGVMDIALWLMWQIIHEIQHYIDYFGNLHGYVHFTYKVGIQSDFALVRHNFCVNKYCIFEHMTQESLHGLLVPLTCKFIIH